MAPRGQRRAGQFRALVHAAGLSPAMAHGRRVLDVDLIGSIAGYSDVAPAVEKLLDDPLDGGLVGAGKHKAGGQ